ncbi:MAG TPA: 50S ribosomal protein L10, partial [Acidobacteriaceae bacterium]
QKVEALAEELRGSTSAIVGTFAKLTVSQDFELRQKVREAGGRYRVLKNKLAARASQGTGIEGALQGLKGVSSVAYTSGDPVALAKALSAWVKDNAEFTFKLGIVDGKVITVEEVQSLATMPGRDEIFAKLLFLINAPAQRLVTVLNAAGRDLAVVLGQGVDKGKFAEGAAAEPAAPPPAASHQEPVAVAEVVPEPAAELATRSAPAEAGVAPEGHEAIAAVTAQDAPVEAAPVEVAAAAAAETAAEARAVEEAPVAAAPAPVEGPAAEGAEAEAESKQAEAAATEDAVEG